MIRGIRRMSSPAQEARPHGGLLLFDEMQGIVQVVSPRKNLDILPGDSLFRTAMRP